jgi:hypothetical protein
MQLSVWEAGAIMPACLRKCMEQQDLTVQRLVQEHLASLSVMRGTDGRLVIIRAQRPDLPRMCPYGTALRCKLGQACQCRHALPL